MVFLKKIILSFEGASKIVDYINVFCSKGHKFVTQRLLLLTLGSKLSPQMPLDRPSTARVGVGAVRALWIRALSALGNNPGPDGYVTVAVPVRPV